MHDVHEELDHDFIVLGGETNGANPTQ